MSRPTKVYIDKAALLHNVQRVKQCAPNQKIIAMVKANAYGCGMQIVLPVLEDYVDAFGVACIEEAMLLRNLGIKRNCILFQGIFSADELELVAQLRLQCVIHQQEQLNWILASPLPHKIKLWVKVNTGMHRLGFPIDEVYDVLSALQDCPWVDAEIGLMTHLACADEPSHPSNESQLKKFGNLRIPPGNILYSIANSAAIIAMPETHVDVIRPGIMLYGVSPFTNKTGTELGLKPVVRLVSAVSAVHDYPADAYIGYGATWHTDRPSKIAVVAIGYGDGYPRHIPNGTPVWINGYRVPIVGRVSMDMLTIDVTQYPEVKLGDTVELWGPNIEVEEVARCAGTIAYELITQLSPRVQRISN